MTKKKDASVAFYKLFVFADRSDVLLMIIGSTGAIANGVSQPLMMVIMAQTINAFGKSNGHDITNKISEVSDLRMNLLLLSTKDLKHLY